MVRSGRILVLDEFSSSVDADTDDMTHRIIHDEFGGQTVIAVAHKLDTILDFDRIVFLDKGKIALLENFWVLKGRSSEPSMKVLPISSLCDVPRSQLAA
ncbi:hypothetical protein ARSEF4850_005365 [Beauveria asiatica]